MILTFIGRLIYIFHELINKYFYTKRKYPEFRSNDKHGDNHTFINWNIHKGYNNFYMYNLEKTLCFLSEQNADHLCLEEVQSMEQANYIKHNLHFDDMVYYNGLCFLTNQTIKSTIEIKMKNRANVLKIKIKERKDSRDYYNIYMVHLTSNISQQPQKEEMEQIIGFLHSETDLENEKVILLGDFNINHKEFDGVLKDKFGLISKINEPTYPCLYPILHLDRLYTNMRVEAETVRSIYSDHKPIRGEIILEN